MPGTDFVLIATSTGGQTGYVAGQEWYFLIVLTLIVAALLFIDLIRRIFSPYSK